MREVELIGVAQLEGIRVFLNHLYEAKGIDVCVLTKFDTPGVNIGVDFFNAEGCSFELQLGLLE
jgi:hypothetical protein